MGTEDVAYAGIEYYHAICVNLGHFVLSEIIHTQKKKCGVILLI